MSKSSNSLGHSVQKWPIIIGVLMVFSLMSPTSTAECRTVWCNGWDGLVSRLSGRIFGPSHQRMAGHHRGPIEIPLMNSNCTILLAGKNVVKIPWVGGQPPYKVTVEGNGQYWNTTTKEAIVEVKEKDFQFKAGNNYSVTIVSVDVTGKNIQSSKKQKRLTVKRWGCSQNYSQVTNQEQIPSKCWLEAFQH
jgi:hypothetical protein